MKKLTKMFTRSVVISILDFLESEKKPDVTTIMNYLGKEQSVVSSLIKEIKNQGLVVSKKKGRHVFYSLSPDFWEIKGSVIDYSGQVATDFPEMNMEQFENFCLKVAHKKANALYGGHPKDGKTTRGKIVEYLDGTAPMLANEIHKALNMDQSLCSVNLSVLNKAGITIFKKVGREVYYRLNYEEINRLKEIEGKLR